MATWDYVILFLRYLSYGMYPDEGKFENQNFMDSKGLLKICIFYVPRKSPHIIW